MSLVSLEPASTPRVLLVYRRSLYDIYVKEYADERIAELLEARDVSVSTLYPAHERQKVALEQVLAAFDRDPFVLNAIYRGDLSTQAVDDVDLMVVVGGDGTMLDASHFANSTAVLGINSDPVTSVGSLCCGSGEDVGELAEAYLRGALTKRPLTRLQVTVNGEPWAPPALNDVLLAHTSPAATSKYILAHGGHRETHTSSGIWVSTATGSSAAIRSAGGEPMALDDPRLQFRTRELYPKPGQTYALTHGFVAPGDRLELIAKMRTAAVYVDGPHLSRDVTYGDRVSVSATSSPFWKVQPAPDEPPTQHDVSAVSIPDDQGV